MPTLEISKNHRVSSGDAQDLSAGQDAVVDANVYLYTSDVYGFGLSCDGLNSVTVNGVVVGGRAGVLLDGTSQLDQGSDLVIGATGYVEGGTYGILSYGQGDHITNNGTIRSELTGIDLAQANGSSIINNGSIVASDTGIQIEGGGNISVTNNGSIIANGYYAYMGSSDSDRIVNNGSIVGNVSMGAGNDRFDGRKGTVDGTIFGGDGSDTIFNSKSGGVMDGGPGNDVLYGNTGTDYFQFSNAGVDTVHNFDVANDKIQLVAGAYPYFKAGQTPDFVMGNQHSNADEYLSYNANNGYLYDHYSTVNGFSTSAIAKLDKGLHLTVNNFVLV